MKILIFGKNGMVGQIVTSYFKDKYDVDAWGRNRFDAVKDPIPNLKQYDYVINCIGLIKQKSNDEQLFKKINSEFPHELARASNKLIHISSDCVFSGNLSERLSYRTSDEKNAEDAYGKSKAEGEPKTAMVLRTSVIGPAKDNSGLFEWFRNAPGPVNGFINHWWSGVTTLELAKIIDSIVSGHAFTPGIFQIAGTKVTKYDLLNYINDAFRLNKNIKLHKDNNVVNRSLYGDIKAKDIKKQLTELYEYENNQNI